jgi:hypothetical protein
MNAQIRPSRNQKKLVKEDSTAEEPKMNPLRKER